MPSSSTFSLLLILSLLPILSSARPCKSILISYYSFTSTSTSTSSDDPITSRFFAVYRFRPVHQVVNHNYPVKEAVNEDIASSFQDRAKDILIVVAGLLFGLGCGALVASTTYLLWSLLTSRSHFFYGSSGGDYGSGSESDEESPKKMGYVKIAATPAAPVKEGYEG